MDEETQVRSLLPELAIVVVQLGEQGTGAGRASALQARRHSESPEG